MADGVLRSAVRCQAQDVDVDGCVAEPPTQAGGDGVAITLAKFGDHLGDAAGGEVLRETFDDPPLNVLPRGSAVAELYSLDGGGNERRIGGDQIEALSGDGRVEVALEGFEIRNAEGLGIETRAADSSWIDVDRDDVCS